VSRFSDWSSSLYFKPSLEATAHSQGSEQPPVVNGNKQPDLPFETSCGSTAELSANLDSPAMTSSGFSTSKYEVSEEGLPARAGVAS
jgi:hypothetical protein